MACSWIMFSSISNRCWDLWGESKQQQLSPEICQAEGLGWEAGLSAHGPGGFSEARLGPNSPRGALKTNTHRQNTSDGEVFNEEHNLCFSFQLWFVTPPPTSGGGGVTWRRHMTEASFLSPRCLGGIQSQSGLATFPTAVWGTDCGAEGMCEAQHWSTAVDLGWKRREIPQFLNRSCAQQRLWRPHPDRTTCRPDEELEAQNYNL